MSGSRTRVPEGRRTGGPADRSPTGDVDHGIGDRPETRRNQTRSARPRRFCSHDWQRPFYHATSDLLLQLRARLDQAAGATLHLGGTSLQIEDAEVATGAAQPHAKPWRADFRIAAEP